MKKMRFIMLSMYALTTCAREDKVPFALYDGIFKGGYVDNGAFLNFTGPNINATCKNSKYLLGTLPSLRFKEDKIAPKNAFVTPNLGIGLTYSYSARAVQLPLYHNAKTATRNGKWRLGLGVGLRLNEFNRKK